MTFLSLFRLELANMWRGFVTLALLSGLSNAAVLATINRAAFAPDRDAIALALVVLVLAIIIYSTAQKALMVKAATLSETTVNMMRTRFVERLQSADLKDVEELDRSEIYTAVSGEMQVLSDGTLNLIIVGQALVLLTVTMFYLAYLSLTALLLAVIFIAFAASLYIRRSQQTSDRLQSAFKLETQMMQGFTDFVEGFKEVKLNAARSSELATNLRHLSVEVSQTRLQTRSSFASDFVTSQVAFFLLTGIMVFIVPLVSTVDRETVVKITASSLFLIGPITTVVTGLPVLQRVNSAAEAILRVQHRLTQLAQSETGRAAPFTKFDRITLDGATFRYDGGEESPFQVGPIDLEIRQGQVVFITGGNGSGKSTLLKLITGLYLPTEGVIRLDDVPIDGSNVSAYRELYSAIFSDYHLFRILYGIRDIDPVEAEELIQLLELERKTKIVGRAFDTIALSSGQRKRLAMISTLLEHRKICVFDEWAADQDPHFREKFYRTIIPQLRGEGKTIIAVTHDERYFGTADVRFHLEEGRLQMLPPAQISAEPR